MPSIANIVVMDGAATPLSHTYSATQGATMGVQALWRERLTAGALKFFPTFTGWIRDAINGSDYLRQRFSLNIPITGVIDGKTVELRASKINVEFIFHEESTEQERKDARTLIRNFLGDALVTTMIEKHESAT